MKKILISGIAVLLSIFMFSCGGGGDDGGAGPTNDYIRIDNNVNSISLAAADEQRKISIYSNCNWSVTIIASNWDLKLDRYEGSGDVDIWLSTGPNTTTTNRSATLIFKSQGITKTLTITQLPGDLSLTVSPTSWEFSADGENKVFTIQGNSAWKVTSKPDWCEIVGASEGKSGESHLEVKVGANPNASKLVGQIIITGEKIIAIDVSQRAKQYVLTVSENSFNIAATGGEASVIVTCNGSWRVSVDQEWCHVNKSSGMANTPNGETLTITCDSNPVAVEKKANVTLYYGNDAGVTPVNIEITLLPGIQPGKNDNNSPE